MDLFKPKMYQKSIYSINYAKLKQKGYNTILMDLDNTIGLITELECSLKNKKFINKLANDFQIVVVSNNSLKRVKRFCQGLNVIYVANSCKPTKRIKRLISTDSKETVLIGDQLVTDIFCGNRCKYFTILVDRLGNKDLKITSINRLIEKFIIKRIKLIRGKYYE